MKRAMLRHNKISGMACFAISVLFMFTLLTFSFASSAQAVQVVAGDEHTVALKSDGTVWAWGRNDFGQLGNGKNTESWVPVPASGLTDVTSIAAGSLHTVALKSDGTVWAWGYNADGELGTGTTPLDHGTYSTVPVQVKDSSGLPFSEVVAVAAGGGHTVALKSDGTVWAWGLNTYGQLGTGTTPLNHGTYSTIPVQVKDSSGLPFSEVVAIAAGTGHTIALKSDGTVWAWGYNNRGQLGLGDSAINDSSVPVRAFHTAGLGILTDIISIAAGGYHTVALKSDGTIYTWGMNDHGQLSGYNDSQRPRAVPGLTDVISIAAAYQHTVALKSDGTVWASGLNDSGQLGNGATNDSHALVQVKDSSGLPFSAVVAVAAGGHHTVALNSDGTVWAWGSNHSGQLGCGICGDRYVPTRVNTESGVPFQVTSLPGVTSLAAGLYHTVALRPDGTVYVWGGNFDGQLGNGTTNYSNFPVIVPGLTNVTSIAAGDSNTFALKSDGTVWAWGFGGDDQLGTGTGFVNTIPAQITGLIGVTSIAAGQGHTVALKSDGTVWALGANYIGQLGTGTTPLQYPYGTYMPIQVPGLTGVTSLAAGSFHTVALKSDGTVWAWGDNNNGQLGTTTPLDHGYYSTIPVEVYIMTGDVISIAAGVWHTVALKSDGTVWAWGKNNYGQLGNGSINDSYVPVKVPGLTGVTSIAAGMYHTLALKADGTVWAWGYNDTGQLGTGTTPLDHGNYSTIPVQVPGLTGVTSLAAGSFHTVALKSDGTVWAWGGNLGNGTNDQSNVPVLSFLIDTTPDPFSFIDRTDVPFLNAFITSNTITVTGINVPVPISVASNSSAGAAYIINGGIRTSSPGIVKPNDRVTVGVKSSANYSDMTYVTLTVGGVSDTFYVLTRSQTQDPLGFIDQHGAPLNTDITSNTITVTGISAGTTISIVNSNSTTAQYSINGIFRSTAGTVNPNDKVTVRLRSSASYLTKTYATLSIGGTNGTFNVTTRAEVTTQTVPPTVPQQSFKFLDQTSVALNTVVTSNVITVSGITGLPASAPISITGGEYSINNGVYTSETGTVTNGDMVTVRQTSSGSYSTMTDATLTINGVSDTFTVTTIAAPVNLPTRYRVTMNNPGLAAGAYHAVALKSDGTVPAWGYNSAGQTDVPSGLADVSAVAAAGGYSAALKSNGTVTIWGPNDYGEGNVPEDLTGVSAIAAGLEHVAALKSNGTVVAWGNNDYDQSAVPAGLSDVTAIAAGVAHTVALKSDGTVAAWGAGDSARTLDPPSVPHFGQSIIPAGLTGVIAIAAGGYHTVALKSDGTVTAWGYNQFGQSAVPADLSGVIAIAAGWYHTVALKSDGTVVAWGDNSMTQTDVPIGLSDVIAITANGDFTVALKSDGTVVAWGDHTFGQLDVPAGLNLGSGRIVCNPTMAALHASASCTVIPGTGYQVADVRVGPIGGALRSVGPVTAYTFSNITADMTIRAIFERSTFSIAASAGPGGNIEPFGTWTVNKGGTASFTIAPDPGYQVLSVIVDDSNRGAQTNYALTNVQADHTIAAYFKAVSYTITASAGAGGNISSPGVNTVNPGSSMTFTITATAGYHIDDVLVDTVSSGPTPTYVFTDIQANHTIAATFAPNPAYIINASAGANGSITPSGAVSALGGTNGQFTMNAAAGYRVADVVVDGSSVGARTSYTFYDVQAAHSIIASFTLDVYTITTSVTNYDYSTPGNGSITVNGSAPPATVNAGASITYTITPNAGYVVYSVLVDGAQQGGVTTYPFTDVKANHTINAYVRPITYTITATAGSGGSISHPGVNTVNSGSDMTFAITPIPGYHIDDVLVDGESAGTVATYPFSNVTDNHTIAATFAANTGYTITASASGNGSISPSGSVSVLAGASQKFTFTPQAGYRSAVVVDGSPMGALTSYTFTNVQAAHTISVSFVLDVYNINVTAAIGGSVTVTGTAITPTLPVTVNGGESSTITVNPGASLTLTITPDSTHQVRSLVDNGSYKYGITTYSLTNIRKDHTINVYFK